MKKWIIFLGVFIVCGCMFFVFGKFSPSGGMTTYTQTLFFNEGTMTIDGKERVNFFNYADNVLSQLCLHLYPNAYRDGATAGVVGLSSYDKAYPNGKSFGDISIESVNYGNGYLEYEVTGKDQNILKINIPELYPDEYIEFEIGFSVRLANINHRLGYGENTINLCNYYPIMCVYENGGFVQDLYNSNGDPFYSKVSNYDVSIEYDETFILASTGNANSTSTDGKTISHIKAECVRDFAMVLSKKFEKKETQFEGVKIGYFYYDDENPDGTVDVIKKVLTLNKKYGAYPYDNLCVVESNFVHGGMEYPMLVLISDDLEDEDTYVNVVVHELCHQWWYGVVGNNQYDYGFLDEGLTDYSTAKFYDEYPEFGHSSEEIFTNASKMYANFVRIYSDVYGDDFSSSMLVRLDEFTNESQYVYLSYVKGMLMFASLEDLLGDKKMDSCLKYYYSCNKFKEATPDDLVDAFCSASGKNLTNFFDSWFNGDVEIIEIK